MKLKTHFVAMAVIASLAACADPSPQGQVSAYSSLPTYALWARHSLVRSPLELAYIEAELGARGEQRSSTRGTYLGQRTAAAKGRQLYTRTESSGSDLDCSDFASSAAAQKAFLAAGGPTRDPNGLDRDGDGLACEWGTYLQRSVSTYQASLRSVRSSAPVRSTPRRSSSRCYVGPRGGTYTITASGNKNYNGC